MICRDKGDSNIFHTSHSVRKIHWLTSKIDISTKFKLIPNILQRINFHDWHLPNLGLENSYQESAPIQPFPRINYFYFSFLNRPIAWIHFHEREGDVKRKLSLGWPQKNVFSPLLSRSIPNLQLYLLST